MTTDRFAEEWAEPLSPINREATPALWKVKVASAASIKPVAIRWLWPGWLAKGKLHILAGAGGTGRRGALGTARAGDDAKGRHLQRVG